MNETASACYHCGEPLPRKPLRAEVLGQERFFCCAGCLAVAEAIIASGLAHYYDERTESSPRAELPEALESLAGYDHPDTQAQFLHRDGNAACAELSLEGMSCAACAWLIEKRLRQEPAVRVASVNLSTRRLHLVWDDQALPLSRLLLAMEKLGYKARPYRNDTHAESLRRDSRRLLMRLGVAGLGSMQVMMYSGSLYLGVDEEQYRQFFRWTCLIVTLPVFFYAGFPFYISAWNALRQKALNMDVPVSVALIATFAISVYATFSHQGDIYFDSVSMFIFFLLAGRYLELRARQRASETAADLTPVLPQLAHRLDETGQPFDIPVTTVAVDDRILVKPGETIPCDGEVLEGHSAVSEALLTGEPLPVGKSAGDRVIGGSQNHDSPLQIRVTQTARTSTLATLHQLINRALSEKPVLAQRADELSQWFVGAILGLSVLVYAAWTLVRPEEALWATLAVLVATCPCALSLATPVALTTATHALARAGLLVTRGHVLETLSRATHVVFDKTGTLTGGQPELVRVTVLTPESDREAVTRLAAALEQHSEHPLAKAFLRLGLTDLPVVTNCISMPGGGLGGKIGDRLYRIGHGGFVSGAPSDTPPPGQIRVWLADDQHCLASFDFQDRTRPESADVIRALKNEGLEPWLLSGDASEAPSVLAAELGITHVMAGASPEAKAACVESIQRRGGVVIMVGDGVNDAPVLGQSHVSIAMNSGADLARITADAILLGDRLSALVTARKTARRCQKIIRQNLYWAFGYNLAIVPPAALGMIPPWMAAVGMSSSSLLVVLNALRLQKTS